MKKYEGVLQFYHEGRTFKIPYTMDNLGGSAHIYYTDKHGHSHSFFYRASEDIWLFGINQTLKWPVEFSQRFFRECDKARISHGL